MTGSPAAEHLPRAGHRRYDAAVALFEYLAIAFSLVFSFAAVRLVGGLAAALDPARRYWVHLAFVVHELLRVVIGFWAFWSFRDLAWTFPTYLLALVGPGVVYFLAATLVPEDPSSVRSWREYYYDVRSRYFLAILCWVAAVAITTTVLLGQPLWHPFRLVQLAFVCFALVGASSESPRIHATLALISLALPVFAVLTVLLRPGSLAN
jgi:hypothetical protein